MQKETKQFWKIVHVSAYRVVQTLYCAIRDPRLIRDQSSIIWPAPHTRVSVAQKYAVIRGSNVFFGTKQKERSKMFRKKMAAKKRIYVSQKGHVTKIWKITFPKEFFIKIWLQVEEHEYIFIFEIKFEKNYSV